MKTVSDQKRLCGEDLQSRNQLLFEKTHKLGGKSGLSQGSGEQVITLSKAVGGSQMVSGSLSTLGLRYLVRLYSGHICEVSGPLVFVLLLLLALVDQLAVWGFGRVGLAWFCTQGLAI